MRIGIVGLGHVGSAMQKVFPKAYIYDKPKNFGTKEGINECDIAFICVPTPQADDKPSQRLTDMVTCQWKFCRLSYMPKVHHLNAETNPSYLDALFSPRYS